MHLKYFEILSPTRFTSCFLYISFSTRHSFPSPSSTSICAEQSIHSQKRRKQRKMDALEALKSTSNMKQMLKDQVLRNGLSRTITYKQSTTIRDESLTSKRSKVESAFSTMNKIAKGKLSLGAKILQLGRVEKEFRRLFSVREGEELLKASRCCLSTTAGPISGCLFISTDKLAFCSDKPIVKFTSPTGELLRFRYKVVIPLTKINRANQCENVKKPSQKYLHMVTKDDFEFWFMGFLNYKGTFKCLQEAVTQKLN